MEDLSPGWLYQPNTKKVEFIKCEPNPEIEENQMFRTQQTSSFNVNECTVRNNGSSLSPQKEVCCNMCNKPFELVRRGSLFIKGCCKNCLYNSSSESGCQADVKPELSVVSEADLKTEVDMNMLCISEVKSLICNSCGETFQTVELYEEHMELSSSKYGCKLCASVFCSKEKLTKHEALHKMDVLLAKKPVARDKNSIKVLPRRILVKRNVTESKTRKVVKQNSKPITRDKFNNCSLCTKNILRHEFEEHMKIHSEEGKSLSDRRKPNYKSVGIVTENRSITLVKYEYLCSSCEEELLDMDSLLEHLKSDSHVNNIVKITGANLSCKLCSNEFINIFELRSHLIKEDHLISYNIKVCDVSMSTCDICDVYFLDDTHLKVHKSLFHVDGDKSNKEVKTKAVVKLVKVDDQNSKQSEFVCKVCSKCFSLEGKLMEHMKQIHQQKCVTDVRTSKKPVASDAREVIVKFKDQYKCKVCRVVIVHKTSILRHLGTKRHKRMIRIKNENVTSEVAKVSESSVNSGQVLVNDVPLKIDSQRIAVKDKRTFACAKINCKAIFPTQVELVCHCVVNRHSTLRLKLNLPCPCCKGCRMSSPHAIIRHVTGKVHISNHIGQVIENSFCMLCDLMVTNLDYENHVKTVSHMEKYVISLTQGSKVKNEAVKKGIVTTSVPKKVKCDICGVTCNSELRLAVHKSIKHGNKNVKCSICHNIYKANRLASHMRVHTRPFHCNYCNKGFPFNYLLVMHLEKCSLLQEAPIEAQTETKIGNI